MPIPYTKNFLSVPDQVSQLRDRGLDVGNLDEAQRLLRQFGYYRLSGYWHPLRQSSATLDENGKLKIVYSNDFVAGATLQQVIGIAEFDRRLRNLFLEACERIEVAFRVAVALLLGPRGAFAHRDGANFHAKFVSKFDPVTGGIPFDDWRVRLDDHERRSKEQFSRHFRQKYIGVMPLWISIEVWDFGMLSKLIGGMTTADQKSIAGQFNITRRELLPSWLRAINHVRNVSAHHSRLWNRSPADQPVPPKKGEIPMLDHLAGDNFAQSRIYATAAIIQYLMRLIEPDAARGWAERLKGLFLTFPDVPSAPITQSGFPVGWEGLPLWDVGELTGTK